MKATPFFPFKCWKTKKNLFRGGDVVVVVVVLSRPKMESNTTAKPLMLFPLGIRQIKSLTTSNCCECACMCVPVRVCVCVCVQRKWVQAIDIFIWALVISLLPCIPFLEQTLSNLKTLLNLNRVKFRNEI